MACGGLTDGAGDLSIRAWNRRSIISVNPGVTTFLAPPPYRLPNRAGQWQPRRDRGLPLPGVFYELVSEPLGSMSHLCSWSKIVYSSSMTNSTCEAAEQP